jgi:hypothetical protein
MNVVQDALRDALRDAEREMGAVERQIDPLMQRRSELGAIVQGLRYAMARQSRDEAHGISDQWTEMSRPAAVERFLTEVERPLSLQEIVAGLREHGRDDPSNSVSAALSRLRDHHRVRTLGRGRWSIAPPTVEAVQQGTVITFASNGMIKPEGPGG